MHKLFTFVLLAGLSLTGCVLPDEQQLQQERIAEKVAKETEKAARDARIITCQTEGISKDACYVVEQNRQIAREQSDRIIGRLNLQTLPVQCHCHK